MTAQRTFPKHYDTTFILEQAGVTNYGYEVGEVETTLHFNVTDYDAVVEAIEAYPVAYRAVMVPRMLAEVANTRAERALAFSFANMPITLNDKTIANLTAATVGLTRNPSVLSIDWALDDATSAELPRDLVLAMADAAFNHVQSCFTAQKVIGAEIKAAPTIEELRAMDIANHEAWPA